MIDGLVNQVLERFSALESELSDPAVIGDRDRYTATRRAYSELEPAAKLAGEYKRAMDDAEGARELIARSLPDALDRLRKRHTAFQALLQTNLTVLATAHAVSEGIIRGVSGELARKRTPSTYGATGRANAPSAKASQPLAISRTL